VARRNGGQEGRLVGAERQLGVVVGRHLGKREKVGRGDVISYNYIELQLSLDLIGHLKGPGKK